MSSTAGLDAVGGLAAYVSSTHGVIGLTKVDALGPTHNRSATYGVLLLAAVLGFAWLVSASLVLARAPGERKRR